MRETTLKKKVLTCAASAVLAVCLAVPALAFATPDPIADYSADAGAPQPSDRAGTTGTDLYLQYEDVGNLADNGVANFKVQVPVAINYVARPSGVIEGPTNAKLINNSKFTVHVSNIKVEDASANARIVKGSVTAVDQVNLMCTPNNGTAGTPIDLADFKSSSGEAPDATEWRMCASGSSVEEDLGEGEKRTVNNELVLSSLTGSAIGFQKLDPSAKVQIGTITWTIIPGWVHEGSGE